MAESLARPEVERWAGYVDDLYRAATDKLDRGNLRECLEFLGRAAEAVEMGEQTWPTASPTFIPLIQDPPV